MGGVLVVGESLVDVVVAADGSRTEHVGGSAANVAVALARLGREVGLLSAWGADPRGSLIEAHLAREGVTVLGDPRSLQRTSTAIATLGADGAASYDFDLEWRLGPLPPDLSPEILYVCSIGAVMGPGADTVRGLVERWRGRAGIVYDVNARPSITGTGPAVREAMMAIVGLADVVKASDEDLTSMFGGHDLDSGMELLQYRGPRAVVVTRGGDGASWRHRDQRVSLRVAPVAVVDTIGAGDTFGAGLVDALWDRLAGAPPPTVMLPAEVAEVMGWAARAAAVTVSRAGANPPYRSELSQPALATAPDWEWE